MDVRRFSRTGAVAAVALLVAFSLYFFYGVQPKSPDLAQLQKTLVERIPKVKVVDIQPASVPGWYEAFTGRSLFYTDATGDYILDGSLIDTRTKKNLTELRINERNVIRFDSLPFERAIKFVKGDGSRRLAVFTDPDCPYCKRLEQEMKLVDNVTMYVFMFPLKIHPNAERHAKSIWCSDDRANGWTAWLLDEREPQDKTCADDPVEANLELGGKLNVSGTPTIYFEDGSRQGGAMKAADLETRMNEAKKR